VTVPYLEIDLSAGNFTHTDAMYAMYAMYGLA
jgi:hypothetical protein